MIKTTLKVNGMVCSMCEAHVNDALRIVFDMERVTSSHRKNETIIISEHEPDEPTIKEAVEGAGYELVSVKHEPYVKKIRFSRTVK